MKFNPKQYKPVIELTLIQIYVESNDNNFQIIQFSEMFRPVFFLSTNVLMLRNRITLIIKVSCYLSMSVYISQRKKPPQSHKNPPTR